MPALDVAHQALSNTGTRGERNAEIWNIGCIAVCVVPNGITAGEWLWITAFTSGRARYAGGAAGGLVQAAGIARGAHGYWVALGPSGPPLPPNSGFGRRIVYSNAQQRIWLVEANGLVSHTFLVSGRHGLPSVGVHQVFSKVTSSPSGDLTLPWTLRFAVSSSGNPIPS